MIKQIGLIAFAVALFLVAGLVIPEEGSSWGVKGKIAIGSYSVMGLRITLNQVLSVYSTLQVTCLLMASFSFISRAAWWTLETKGAPISILDIPQRAFGQIGLLMLGKSTPVVVGLSSIAIFVSVATSIESVLLQRTIVLDSTWALPNLNISFVDTSQFDPAQRPIVVYLYLGGGISTIDPSYIPSNHFLAGMSGFLDVNDACISNTSNCASSTTSNTPSLIQCDSNSVDCMASVELFNDYSISCNSYAGTQFVNGIQSMKLRGVFPFFSNWVTSSVRADSVIVGQLQFPRTITWNITKMDPKEIATVGLNGTARTTTVSCKINAAWSTRLEQFSVGTLSRTVRHIYDVGGASDWDQKRPNFMTNYSSENPLSFLPVNDYNLTSAQETLHFIQTVLMASNGTCTGTKEDIPNSPRFQCSNALLPAMGYTTSPEFDPVITPKMIAQEMEYVVDRIVRRISSSAMTYKLYTDSYCPNCSQQQVGNWVRKSTFWAIVGVMNGMSLLLGIGSLILVSRNKVPDFDVTAAKTAAALGAKVTNDQEFRNPIQVHSSSLSLSRRDVVEDGIGFEMNGISKSPKQYSTFSE